MRNRYRRLGCHAHGRPGLRQPSQARQSRFLGSMPSTVQRKWLARRIVRQHRVRLEMCVPRQDRPFGEKESQHQLLVHGQLGRLGSCSGREQPVLLEVPGLLEPHLRPPLRKRGSESNYNYMQSHKLMNNFDMKSFDQNLTKFTRALKPSS